MAQSEVIEIVKKYLRVLRNAGIHIEQAYLYGRHSLGQASANSDIDVMLVAEKEDDYLTGKIWSLTRKVSVKIEPYLVGKGRFTQSEGSPLIEVVKSTGLKIEL